MTSEKEYEGGDEEDYELKLLKDLRNTVRSIDGRVEDILDELREHLPGVGGAENGLALRDFYDGDYYDLK